MAYRRILIYRQRFCDCVARSLRHSLLVQRNAGRIRLRGICARKHAQGTAPRPAHAPRDPPENGQGGRAKQQRCCAQRRKFLCSGQNLFARRAARHDSSLASPRGLRSRGAAMNRSPGETENRSSACGTATDTSRSETAVSVS